MYFLREKVVIGALGGTTPAAEIKVDGKTVGSVTNGSYIFVDRSPGPLNFLFKREYRLRSKTEVQVEAGRAYYFNIGVPTSGAPGRDLLNQIYAGGSGQQMRAQSPLTTGFSGAVFFSLDPSAGAAEIERLKAP